MPSSSFICVKPSELEAVSRAVRAYKKMSSVTVVTQAARKAGEHLNTAMQKTVKGEPSLADFHHVADAFHVHDTPRNVYVGLPDSHQLHDTAWQMHGVYPVSDAVMDLTQQQGDTEEKFYEALAEAVSR